MAAVHLVESAFTIDIGVICPPKLDVAATTARAPEAQGTQAAAAATVRFLPTAHGRWALASALTGHRSAGTGARRAAAAGAAGAAARGGAARARPGQLDNRGIGHLLDLERRA